nr:hypothetical protein [Sedimentibacter sp.]
MKYEIQKISKIVEEIIDFFYSHSTKKVNISIEETKDSFIIEVQSDHIICSNDNANQLKDLLNVQRQREMEEYYWQLAGNDLDGDEYNLVGMMVDESYVDFKNPSLKVKLVRYK